MENSSKERKKRSKEELWRAIKFTLFSISAGAIQLISSTVLKLVLDAAIKSPIPFEFIIPQDVSTFVADTVGLALSVIWNFTFNRKFTFKTASNVPIAMTLAFLFYVPFYPFQIWFVPMVEQGLKIGFWGYLIGLVSCMIINFILEFLWQRLVVFRKTINTKPLAKTVEMKLRSKPFEQIKNGEKRVEMRCNDEKRKALKVSDHIIFTNDETGEKIKTKIAKIQHFENFEKLYEAYDKKDLGYHENEPALPEDMSQYYSAEDMADGVVAIELAAVKEIKK